MLYWLTKQTKRLLVEMSVGVILFNVVLAAAAIVLLPKTSYPVLPVVKGLFVGAAAAVLMLIHMADTTERVLTSGDPDYAKKSTIAQSMIRKVVFLAGLAGCWYFFGADPLAMVIGTMGMKAGAYLQPTIHRIFCGPGEPGSENLKEEIFEEEKSQEEKSEEDSEDGDRES